MGNYCYSLGQKSLTIKMLYNKYVLLKYNRFQEIGYQIKQSNKNTEINKKFSDFSSFVKNLDSSKIFLNKSKFIKNIKKIFLKFDNEIPEFLRFSNQTSQIISKIIKNITTKFPEIKINLECTLVKKVNVFLNSKMQTKETNNIMYSCICHVSKEDGRFHRIFLTGSGNKNFAELLKLEKKITEYILDIDLLDRNFKEKNISGNYNIIMSQEVAALFFHEALGHLLEHDNFERNNTIKVGQKISDQKLTVIDDPTLKGYCGSFKYDDEGVKSNKKILVKDGVIKNTLGNIKFSHTTGNNISGNARALDINYEPIIRMSNFYVKPTQKKLSTVISEYDGALYLDELLGGNTDQNSFNINVGKVFKIYHGKKYLYCTQKIFKFDILEAISKIVFIGNDLSWIHGGSCGKLNQNPLIVDMGSPHIIIENITV